MRLLCVLSPSNQMYSGIGRAIFELAARLKDRIRFEFAMSDYFTKNLDILRRFCTRHGFPLHVAPGQVVPGSFDVFNDGLADLMSQRRWDVIECICWANAAVNEGVLKHLRDEVLCYTPHDQPLWTVPMPPSEAAHVETTHRRMLRRADLVCCDSLWECDRLRLPDGQPLQTRFIPLGCDFNQFRPGALERREQLLFVGDLAEPRKRFDRVLAVIERLRVRRPSLRLVVVGNRSQEVGALIPAHLRPACDLLGYVDEADLQRAYAESAGLLLLSDFEAFGIPILEALACGTPVFLSPLNETRSLFGSYRGAYVCPVHDLDATVALIEDVLGRGQASIAETLTDLGRLRATFDWDRLADLKWQALAAAWFRAHAWGWREPRHAEARRARSCVPSL
jgi:glycosyltransferase involved in cell wall biosynthesis